MKLICYPACSTCRKAAAWLESQGLSFAERNIKEDNPSCQELTQWQAASGLPLKRFFNTSGLRYRELELKDKLPNMSREEQLQLLSSDGMLVKRPILLTGDKVLVGFRQAEWEAALNRK